MMGPLPFPVERRAYLLRLSPAGQSVAEDIPGMGGTRGFPRPVTTEPGEEE